MTYKTPLDRVRALAVASTQTWDGVTTNGHNWGNWVLLALGEENDEFVPEWVEEVLASQVDTVTETC